MKVSVFGSGYVGLVQAAVLAEAGHEVLCVDIDEKKIDMLRMGKSPIFEPGLSDLVLSGMKNNCLSFTTSAHDAVQHGDIIFIAVGTPPGEDGSADLSHVTSVARTISELSNKVSHRKHTVVVNKSTVPVGTAEMVMRTLKTYSDSSFSVVSNPEFLKEGAAIEDCRRPDRIIIGIKDGDSDAEVAMRELYSSFNRQSERVMIMDQRSAELTKYAANCMLATKISFINEIARIAQKTGADIEQVRKGIGADPRIGPHFIYPGCGYGGSCFPKDVKALISLGATLGIELELLNSVETVNEKQKEFIADAISFAYKNQGIKGKVFALWGLSFKPNTDDMREAPSLVTIKRLLDLGATLQVFDPVSMEETKKIIGEHPRVIYANTKEDATIGAHALVVHTEWSNFRAPNFASLNESLIDKLVFDGRNIYRPADMKAHGLTYYGIARGESLTF